MAEKWHSYTLLFFDTVCDVKVRCSDNRLLAAQEEVRRIFTSIEDHFGPNSNDLTSPPVLELYQMAVDVFNKSGGCFDISVGPLLELWGFTSGAHRLPRVEEIQATLGAVGMTKIALADNGIALLPGMKLDWGGIAKGRAVDLASRALMGMGIRDGFINAGGDLFCWGKNPARSDWRIGLKHPRRTGFLGVIVATNTAVATSGDYQKYFERDGRRYHHIFDPKTGYPAGGKKSVTVIGPEAALCDALSTALFVSPSPEAILRNYPEYGAIWIADDETIHRAGKIVPFEPF